MLIHARFAYDKETIQDPDISFKRHDHSAYHFDKHVALLKL
jgi:hypothetical protein